MNTSDNSGNRRILLIATGGTIACTPGSRGLTPTLAAADMLDFIPKPAVEVECIDLLSLDSSNVQPEEWLVMAREVTERAKTGKYRGIVLTHGTDTMAYTASALSFLLLGVKIPVVLTGSQHPIIQPDSDGRTNLADAIIAACALGRGVYVCFGHAVMLGCRAVKTHTFSLNAFESINYPYIGSVQNNAYTPLNAEYAPPAIDSPKFSGEVLAMDPRVALIKLIPGTSPGMIEAALSCGIAGVVVETFGMGGVHSIRRDHNSSFKMLMENGIAVVLASQCLNEASSLDVYEVSRPLRETGAISAKDMTTEAAVTKLMWALSHTRDFGELDAIMSRNCCGEIMNN